MNTATSRPLAPTAVISFSNPVKCLEENILEKCDIQNSKCEIPKAGFSWWNLEFVFHVSALMSYLKTFLVILSFWNKNPVPTLTHTLSLDLYSGDWITD